MRENYNSNTNLIRNQNSFLNQNSNQINMERTLRKHIGRKCLCEFNIDEDLVKKTGILTDVGVDYIVLTSINNPDEFLICNLEDLKFIKIS